MESVKAETHIYEHYYLSDDKFRRFVFKELNEMRKREFLTDVIILTDNGSRRFAAHRAVLAASSRYFHKLYNGTTLARYSRETVLSGICERVLEKVINYMYTSEIRIEGENVRALLHGAFNLELDLLSHECERYLIQHLHHGNSIEMMVLAQMYSCDKLLKGAKQCISENFLKLRNTQPFYRMPTDQLKEIIADDDLNVTKEEEVYESVIGWIRYDFERRRDHFAKLVAHVRLPFISRRYLVSTVDKEPLVTTSEYCRGLVAEALTFKLADKKNKTAMQNAGNKRRWRTYLMEAVVIVGGLTEDSGPGDCSHCYNPLTGKWYSLAKIKQGRLNFGLARVDYWLIAIGGCSATESLHLLPSAERFDPKYNKWEKISSLNQARLKCEAVEVGGKIYALGGMTGGDTLTKSTAVECYDPVIDTWVLKSAPRQLRHTHCAAVLSGHIYIIGGLSRSNTVLSTVERYDPQHDRWTTAATLSTPRSGACAVALGDQIYVMGGSSDRMALSSCEVYHPDQDKWTQFADMSTKRDRADAAIFGGKIFIVGGSYGNIVVDSVECYNPVIDRWKIVTQLPQARHGFRCLTAVVNKELVEEVRVRKALTSEKLI